MRPLDGCDVFLSKAAAEVLPMYGLGSGDFPEGARIYHDKAASSPIVARFYSGDYHTLVVAPATSNSVAKFVSGISDTLVTNLFAQAGKCRIPTIVLGCDTAPDMETLAPGGVVKVYPRQIDLDNVDRLRSFDLVEVVETVEELDAAIGRRLACLNTSSS